MMHLVHPGVQHIRFDRSPDVVKDNPIWHILAAGDSGPLACFFKGFMDSSGRSDRLIQVGKHKVMAQGADHLRQHPLDVSVCPIGWWYSGIAGQSNSSQNPGSRGRPMTAMTAGIKRNKLGCNISSQKLSGISWGSFIQKVEALTPRGRLGGCRSSRHEPPIRESKSTNS